MTDFCLILMSQCITCYCRCWYC